MIPNQTFVDQLHPAQLDVLARLDAGEGRFFVLEWHRRARKTTLALNILIRACCKYPKAIFTYVGPTYRQARDIVWDDPKMLDAYLPDKREMGWKKNEQKLQVRFANESLLRICGADDPDTLRGPDTAGVVFDEWAMIQPLAWTEIFRPIIAQDVKRWAMFLYTPKGLNHATDMCDAVLSGKLGSEWYAQVLRASQSGLMPVAELTKASREMPPTLYEQEFECARITDEDRVLITSRMLAGLENYGRSHESLIGRRVVACDPALGGDECVCQYIVAGEIVEQVILHDRDGMKVAGTLAVMGERHKCRNYVLDVIGLGGPIANRLTELGKYVARFNSAEMAEADDRFANRRVEAWWHAMELIQAKHIPPVKDEMLFRQLCATHWKPQGSGGRLILEPKENTKKTLGQSPDRADAFVMGLWALRTIEPDCADTMRDRNRSYAGSWRTA